MALTQELPCALVVRARPLLRPDLDHAPMTARGVEHPLTLAEDMCQGFLDVDVLAGGARHHRHQGVPVVWRRDDHGVDVWSVEHPAEVVEGRRPVARGRDAVVPPFIRDLADPRDFAIRLRLEVQQVPSPDQPDADEADAHAVVGARHAPRRGGRRQRGSGQGLQKRSSMGHRQFAIVYHPHR